MQRLLIAALLVGGGLVVWSEYGGALGVSAPSSNGGGMGFSSFGKSAGTVAAGAKAAVR